MLKERIAETYGASATLDLLAVRVVAFGFKFGVPLDADLVFDVRFFSNPNYVAELKALTGPRRTRRPVHGSAARYATVPRASLGPRRFSSCRATGVKARRD